MAAERDEEARRAHGADAREGGTIVTYARTCLDTFRERPLGAVDSLILSWFAYFRLPSALLRDVPALTGPEGAPLPALMRAEFFDEMMGTSWDPEGSRELLCAACASPRKSSRGEAASGCGVGCAVAVARAGAGVGAGVAAGPCAWTSAACARSALQFKGSNGTQPTPWK